MKLLKKIMALCTALAMMVVLSSNMAMSVLADEVKYFKCTGGEVYFSSTGTYGDFSEQVDVTGAYLEYGVDYRYFKYTTDEGGFSIYQKFNGTSWDYVEINGVASKWTDDDRIHDFFILNEDNIVETDYYKAGGVSVGIEEPGPMPGFEHDRFGFYLFFLTFEEVDTSVYEISVPFAGTAVSDRGDYTLSLAGYFEKNLESGTHVLTGNDITEQTIAIVACNNADGVKRVMRENTVEEITVTVIGGEITEIIIKGRVQTSGGTLDRYTAVFN